MATQTQEFKAKSVEEAIEEGLEVLGVARDAVEIEIINKGSRGIFGIGSEPAVVRLTLRSATPPLESSEPTTVDAVSVGEVASTTGASTIVSPSTPDEAAESASAQVPSLAATPTSSPFVEDGASHSKLADEDSTDDAAGDDHDDDEYADEDGEPNTTEDEEELATMAADLLDEMIHLMGFKAEVNATWFDDEDEDDYEEDEEAEEAGDQRRRRYLRLDVEGTDLGALIGRRGETLENIQYLLRLMVNQKIHRWKNIIVDVERYKERRVNQLTQLAERMADQVARSGRAISLEPMPANERRIIHMVLRNHPDVYTESYGDGPRRKVHIFLRD